MKKLSTRQALVLILLIAVSWIILWFFTQQDHKEGEKQLEMLRTLSSDQIEQIRIHEGNSKKSEYISIKDNNLLADFCYALNHLQDWQANHHWPKHSFYVKLFLNSGPVFEFDMSLKSFDSTVYVIGARYWGPVYSATYEAKSEHLYSWLIKAGVFKQN